MINLFVIAASNAICLKTRWMQKCEMLRRFYDSIGLVTDPLKTENVTQVQDQCRKRC